MMVKPLVIKKLTLNLDVNTILYFKICIFVA